MKNDLTDVCASPSQSVDIVDHSSLFAAVEQAADGVVITGTNGLIQYVNPAFTAMTGYAREEAVGQNPRILKSERHPEPFYKEMWSTILSGRVWDGELTNRRKDGTLYEESMRIAPVRNSEGGTTGYIAIKHDVSERRGVEQARAFLAAIVECSEDAIVSTSPSGILLTWNRGAETLLGFTAEQAIGQHAFTFIPPDRHSNMARCLEHVSKGKPLSNYQGVCQRADGRQVHVTVTGFPIKDSAGKVVAITSIIRDDTTRHEAEQAQALLASIVESSDDGIIACTPAGVITTWNSGASRLFGFSAADVIGNPAAMLVAPDRLEDVEHCLGQVTQGITLSQFESVCVRKDESRIDVSITASPIRNAAGDVVSISATVRDVTARKQFERQLRESEERFQEVFEHAPVGICLAAQDGRFIQVNGAFCQMLGYPRQELLEKPWPELTHPDDLPAASERKAKLWSGEIAIAEGERRYFHRTGKLVWCHVRLALLRTAEGVPLCTVVHAEDISERKHAEEKLRESEERFRSMADCTPSMMWVTDAEGNIEFINRAYREFSGMTCEEARAGKWRVLLHPDDADEYVEAFHCAMKEHSSFSAEVRVRRADGEWRLAGTRAEPRFSPDGEYCGHIGLRADITDRRQAENERQFQHSLIRTIQEVSLDGIVVVNDKGTIVSNNEKFLDVWQIHASTIEAQARPIDFTSCAPEQPLLMALRERVKYPDEFMKRARRDYADLGSRKHFETELKDGRTLERYSASLWNEGDHYLGRVWFFRDITERKHSEQALRESEERFHVMADGCPMPMWVTDIDGGIQFTNRNFREFCGIAHEHVDGRKWELLIHPDEMQDFLKRTNWSVMQHMPLKTEARVKRADGEWRWFLICAEPRFSKGGKFLGHVGLGVDIAERRQAEEALLESEGRFRIMADSCPIGIWATDAEGGTRFMNRTFLRFFGASADQLEPDAWQSVLHPDDVSEFAEPFQCALKQHSPFMADARFRRGDGEWRWVESVAAPRFSASGEFLGLVGTSKDITDRKQAEQALQSSEEKFRQLAENIRQVFWMMNFEGTEILYVGPAYEQIWGRTCESLYASPMDWMDAIHPEDRASAHETFLKQLQGESIDSEYRISTPDGHERWIRDRAFPVRNEAGELVRIAGIAEEITERKLQEEELIRAYAKAEAANLSLSEHHIVLDRERKLLRAFIDNVPDLMYVKDLESRFVIANFEVARRMGVEKPEDLIGKSDSDFYPREFAARFYENEQRVIRSGEPMVDYEETISMPATGEMNYLLSTKVPLFDGKGNVTGIAGIGRDITMRKSIEDALTESNLDLREATDWATKMALEAEAANRAKSEFLANMSHEIRTPMNGVLGMNGLLLGSDLDQEQRHYAEVVDSSAKSLLTVIDDILDYSKVEAGKLEIDVVDFNLQLLMDDFAEMMAQRVGDKHLEFVCAVAPNVCTSLDGDPGRLRQVLLNLGSNAMKFTHQGEVAVRVELISETDSEVWLRFSVRDTGIGIPANRQQMLFTSFTQVDASTTRQYGGTGLGLAISKKLVELMGGEIGLKSKEGEGSEFWFTLRLQKQPAKRKVDSPHSAVKGTRILVVDDNATNREVLTAQLQSWGAVVAAVESGSTALACLRYAVATGSSFQLAILDMMMPGMDGATLGRTILADDTLSSIPLVMMTSLGQRGDAVRFKEIGFAAYLIKPVRQSDLFDCLGAVLPGGQIKAARSLITRHSLLETRRSVARILLVEDNLTNQEVAGGMLRRMGWQADVAANGKLAVQALEAQPYDLVLMDVQMPEMDGYEATRIIRDPLSPILNHDVPIIATTAHAMAGDAQKCLAAGMNDYISKPIDPKILAKLVEKWLPQRASSSPGGPVVGSAKVDIASSPDSVDGSMIFNRELFLSRMMGDEGFAREIAAQLLEELPALLSKLMESVEQKDLESVWKQAHKMKGASANVGGEALSGVAFELEQAGKASDLAGVVHLVSELEFHTAKLSAELQQFVN
ncbi:MAG: PAS domain S-box protein [Terracidiphilus sp.]